MGVNIYLIRILLFVALNEKMRFPAAEYFVSVITEIELLSFPPLTQNEEVQIKRFLKDINVVELTEEVKARTILLRRQSKLKLPDAIICASAGLAHATLISEDLRLHKAVDSVLTLSNFRSACG